MLTASVTKRRKESREQPETSPGDSDEATTIKREKRISTKLLSGAPWESQFRISFKIRPSSWSLSVEEMTFSREKIHTGEFAGRLDNIIYPIGSLDHKKVKDSQNNTLFGGVITIAAKELMPYAATKYVDIIDFYPL